jgi:hypothetical protein
MLCSSDRVLSKKVQLQFRRVEKNGRGRHFQRL